MLLGFDPIKSSLLDSYHNKKLPHAILLHGKKGIGKSSFAKELVEEILGSKAAFTSDCLIIEKDEGKKDITVEKIRQISDFVNQTSAISGKKFFIVDSACDLNRSASNAILKILEEPKNDNFFILISHNLTKILPTIRSRCRIIKVPDLTEEVFHQILQQKKVSLSGKELKLVAEICNNSPSDAIELGPDLVRFYELFLRSILNKKISDDLLKKVSDKNFPFVIFEKNFEFFCSRLTKTLSGLKVNFFGDEEAVFKNIILESSAEKIFLLTDESLNLLRKTTPLYLDKKLTLINIFNNFALS